MKTIGSSVVHQSKRTMLKTDILFLEREIKSRKQRFGVEVYELMETLDDMNVHHHRHHDPSSSSSHHHNNNNNTKDYLEEQIRQTFDQAKRDVSIAHEKVAVKRQELEQFEYESSGGRVGNNNNGNSEENFTTEDEDEYGY